MVFVRIRDAGWVFVANAVTVFLFGQTLDPMVRGAAWQHRERP
jgi:hypothetical protein